MKRVILSDLQERVQDISAFGTLNDYMKIGRTFLDFIERTKPTRIISPSHSNYIFYQYGKDYGHKITRPLNIDLFIESPTDFEKAFDRFIAFLVDIKQFQAAANDQKGNKQYN